MTIKYFFFVSSCLAAFTTRTFAQDKFDIIPLAEGLYMHRSIDTSSANSRVQFNGLLIDASVGYVLFNPCSSIDQSKKLEAWISANDEKPILMLVLTDADTNLIESANYFLQHGSIVSTTPEIARWYNTKMEFSPSGFLVSGNYTIGDLSFDVLSLGDMEAAIWINKYELIYGLDETMNLETDKSSWYSKTNSAKLIIPLNGAPGSEN